jgi:hypothetical protein
VRFREMRMPGRRGWPGRAHPRIRGSRVMEFVFWHPSGSSQSEAAPVRGDSPRPRFVLDGAAGARDAGGRLRRRSGTPRCRSRMRSLLRTRSRCWRGSERSPPRPPQSSSPGTTPASRTSGSCSRLAVTTSVGCVRSSQPARSRRSMPTSTRGRSSGRGRRRWCGSSCRGRFAERRSERARRPAWRRTSLDDDRMEQRYPTTTLPCMNGWMMQTNV